MQKLGVPRRAVLRYFGGKWSLAPWILDHLPAHRIYVEPFGGAASVLLRKPRSPVEVYNDLDDEIVGLFRVLQDPGQCRQLMRKLRHTPYSRSEFLLAFQPALDPVERSRRAVVRAYQSFHHSSLFNSQKTSFSDCRHKTGSAMAHNWSGYWRSLAAVHARLQSVLIEQRPAAQVIAAQDCHDAVFFIDPPYLPATRGADGRYRHEMSADDHVALLTQLQGLAGRAVVAGYPSEMYDDMLAGWQRVTKPARAAGSRSARTEVLWISPARD